MNHFFEFVLAHWELWLAFLLILSILIAVELTEKISGGARLSPQQVVVLLNQQHALVLDIRDKATFAAGHIPGARNVTKESLDKKPKFWEKYRQKTLIICCTAGQQASIFGTKLRKLGFTQVNILHGGIQAWKDAGMPLTTRPQHREQQHGK